MDLLSSILLFAVLICAVACFVYARRIFVMQRNIDLVQSEMFGSDKKKRGQMRRLQTKSGTWFEAKLLCAGFDVSPVVFVAGVVLATLIVGSLLQGIMPGIGFVAAIPVAVGGAWIFLNMAASNRSKKFDKQLAAALPMVAENLRGGSGLETSINAVAQFMPDPLHTELKRVIDDTATASLTLPESFERLGARLDSKEAHFLATSFLIQKEGGGNLANMIDTVADTIAKRIELRDQIKSSTSNARFSAIFVSAMPFAVFAIFSFATPDYMAAFWAFPFWPVIFAAAAVLDLAGLIVIRRMYTMKLE